MHPTSVSLLPFPPSLHSFPSLYLSSPYLPAMFLFLSLLPFFSPSLPHPSKLENMDVVVADHVQRVMKPNFAASWDEIGEENQIEETFALSSMKDIPGGYGCECTSSSSSSLTSLLLPACVGKVSPKMLFLKLISKEVPIILKKFTKKIL